ncbi:MAG: hypothetical protein OEW39_16275, partial [Deltaproteobacteria bacterium]|nr:hypothetical protein [Deltaproteobacteria bacterium]
MKLPALVLVKSANDIGSAVAHRLKREGLRPILVESANPGVIRRLMAFAPAVHEGLAQLEGLQAVRCETEDAVNACWE